jgi:hypothetical protein
LLAISGATIAGLVNAGIAVYNGFQNREIAQAASENDRILEAIKLGNSVEVRKAIEFLIEARLVSDADVIQGVQDYYGSRVQGDGPGVNAARIDDPDYVRDFFLFMEQLNLRHFNPDQLLFLGARSLDETNPLYGENTVPPREYWNNLAALARVIDELSNRLDAEIEIISGYRNPSYNAQLNGERESLHLTGQAADLRAKGISSEKLFVTLQAMRAEGVFAGGIGHYPTVNMVHLDIRGVNATW